MLSILKSGREKTRMARKLPPLREPLEMCRQVHRRGCCLTAWKRSHGPLELGCLACSAGQAAVVARDAGSGDSVGASGSIGLHARRIDREGDTPLIGQLARGWTQAARSWDKTYARCRKDLSATRGTKGAERKANYLSNGTQRAVCLSLRLCVSA